jgi:hypothetical protein
MAKKVLTFAALIMFVCAGLAVTFAQPTPPANLTATVVGAGNHQLGVKLTWTGDSSMGVKYNVYRKDGALADTGAFKKIRMGDLRNKSFVDFMVMPNKAYSYYVTAVKNNVESQPSEKVEITIGQPQQGTAKVYGIVTNAATGAPVVRACVKLFGNNSGFNKNVMTDSTGKYILTAGAGSYFLQVSARDFVPQFYNNVTNLRDATVITLANNDSLGIDVALNAIVPPVKFYLSGSVKDSTGNALRAKVTAFKLVHNSYHNSPKDVRTDSLGNYKIEVNQGDTVVVYAEPMNRNLVAEFYDNQNNINDANRIGVSGNVTDINFVLSPKPVYANGISGTIKDTAGVPVQGHVTAFKKQPLGGRNNQQHPEYTVESDSLGVYSLTNLVPGEYIVMVHPQGDYRPTFYKYDGTQTMNWKKADSIVVTESAVVTDINFVVRACTGGGNAGIGGKIFQNNGSIVNGAMVYAVDANGEVAGYAVSNASGNYVMEGLIPGQYVVSTDKIGYDAGSNQTVSVDYLNNILGSATLYLTPENTTDVETSSSNVISSFSLSQNYPNPFNPSTQITYQVPANVNVVVKVYNVLGAEVAVLVNGMQTAGSHTITFNAGNLSSGIYFYTIKAGNFTATKKLVLMK